MLSRPQMNRVKRLFLYPSHTSLNITISSDLPTGWHILSPLFSVSEWCGKNFLWKLLRLIQIILTGLCQGVMKWAIVSLHQRVRFHKVHPLMACYRWNRAASLLSPFWAVVFISTQCQLCCSSDNLMSQFSSLNWQKTVNFFSCLIFYSLWDEPAHAGVTEHSQHAVMNQGHAWVGGLPDGKEEEDVRSEQ